MGAWRGAGRVRHNVWGDIITIYSVWENWYTGTGTLALGEEMALVPIGNAEERRLQHADTNHIPMGPDWDPRQSNPPYYLPRWSSATLLVPRKSSLLVMTL